MASAEKPTKGKRDSIPFEVLETEYIVNPDLTILRLSRSRKVDYNRLRKHAVEHRWAERRQEYLDNLRDEMLANHRTIMAESHVKLASWARDFTQSILPAIGDAVHATALRAKRDAEADLTGDRVPFESRTSAMLFEGMMALVDKLMMLGSEASPQPSQMDADVRMMLATSKAAEASGALPPIDVAIVNGNGHANGKG